ncbi:MAG: nitroreductase [Clostridiales bacterium]|nr:nitroreductase [Clostridiales bacterium]
MTAKECMLSRRSTRAFKPDKVDKALLEQIAEAGLYAPSAMNEQPWTLTVVTNAQKLAAVNAAVKKYFASTGDERLAARAADKNYCCYYGAPVLIIVSCEAGSLYPVEDASCALQNIFLSAHELGLGSCWINQLGGAACDYPAVRELLDGFGVPSADKVYGCAAIGYIASETETKPRRGKVKFVD